MFAHTQLLRNWSQQWPSNEEHLDSGVKEKAGSVYHVWTALLLTALCTAVLWLLLDSASNATLCTTLYAALN
jgi:hypothetical protein